MSETANKKARPGKGRRVLLCCLAALLVLTAACVWYLTDHYPAEDAALAVLTMDGVTAKKGLTVLQPRTPGDTALIFYPGAKVQEEAYLPLLEALRSRCGITCILVEMPFYMAIFDTDAALDVMAAYPQFEHWYIAGHSMGGAMASSFAAENPDLVQGVILLGAYPYGDYPLKDTLTVYGSLNTSVAEQVDYTQNVVVIQGGNHAQFGNYGHQKGDAVASITALEQQTRTVDAIEIFLAQQAG